MSEPSERARRLVKDLMRACLMPDDTDRTSWAAYEVHEYISKLEAVAADARAAVWTDASCSYHKDLAKSLDRLAVLDGREG